MSRKRRRTPAGEREPSPPGVARTDHGPLAARSGKRGIACVRKRDGRVVPFQRQKITEAVLRAMEAAGEPDPAFAAEVAGIVELSLAETLERGNTGGERAIPEIEAVQDLVERVLMELGRPASAKACILHRDLRARVRATLCVHRSDALRSPVRVREREGVSSWSKGRIVAALMQEAELARESAEEVAAAVEQRVFASGLKRVTTGLVRELVAGELFERGWIRALSAARVVGLARHDVRALLGGFPLHPWSLPARSEPAQALRDRLAGELLARYALENVLPEGPGELHRSGDLHVVGLGELVRPLSLCVAAELLADGGEPSRSAYGVLDRLAELARSVSRTVVLECPAAVLAPLARATREGSPHGLAAWLRALGALARGTGVALELGTSGARFRAFTARLIEELADLPAGHAPRLYVEGSELEDLLRERPDLESPVERLLECGGLLGSWNGEHETFAGPGCVRRLDEPGIVACGAAVALDLPRLARRAGPFCEELFLNGLAELVQAAVEIARAARAGLAALPRPPGVHARVSFALVPVGLREALRTLGDGSVDPEQGARVLGVLGDAARRFSRDELLETVPCPFFGEEAAARFACLDARATRTSGERQVWLFDEAEAETGEFRPYSQGFRLSPAAGLAAGRAEALALRTVPAGALAFHDVVACTEGAERPFLEAMRRFHRERAAPGEIAVPLFPLTSAPPPRGTRRTSLRPLA